MSKVRFWTLLSALLLVIPSQTRALEIPSGSRADGRIQYAAFAPGNVTRVNAVNGYITTVTFAEGEEVLNYGSGFSSAWEFSAAGNHFFLKPKGRDGTTNVVVVTSQHTYSLDIHLMQDPAKATYQLIFRYPKAAARAQASDRARRELEEALSLPDPNVAKVHEYIEGANYQYLYRVGESRGSARLIPLRVFDDGRFTYFLFEKNTDLPAVYAMTSRGETVVQSHLEEGVLVVHGVYSSYRLRADGDVVGIYNASSKYGAEGDRQGGEA